MTISRTTPRAATARQAPAPSPALAGGDTSPGDAPIADILARLAAAERALAARSARLPRRRGRAGLLMVAVLTLLLALAPLAALADDRFGDVPAGNPHHDDIALIAAAGITRGCNPPDNTAYCPTDFVTRQQMASFLARTAGLGGNPPVANALTAVSAQAATSATSAAHATSADNAADAATLGGRGADGLVRVARAATTEVSGQAGFFIIPGTAVYPTFAPMRDAAITIQAPAAGFVLVTAVVGHSEAADERLFARLRDTTPGTPAGAVSQLATAANRDGQARGQLTLTWIFPVGGGGARTFALEVAQAGGAVPDDVLTYNAALTALYVPFGYDGGASLAP